MLRQFLILASFSVLVFACGYTSRIKLDCDSQSGSACSVQTDASVTNPTDVGLTPVDAMVRDEDVNPRFDATQNPDGAVLNCGFPETNSGCSEGTVCRRTGSCEAVQIPAQSESPYSGTSEFYDGATATFRSSSTTICDNGNQSRLQFIATSQLTATSSSPSEWIETGACQHHPDTLLQSSATGPALLVRIPNVLASVSSSPSSWFRIPVSADRANLACDAGTTAAVQARFGSRWLTLEGGYVDVRRLHQSDAYQAIVYGYGLDGTSTRYVMLVLNLGNAMYWC